MSYKTDRNISLYSTAELETMLRIYGNKNANHSAIPFNLTDIVAELKNRNNQ